MLAALVGVTALVVAELCSKYYVYKPFCITDMYGRRQSVPCGKCYECLREKQQEWCFRIDQELKVAKVSFFVTLTYSEENLIYGTSEAILYKPHLQKHFKMLRKHLETRSLKYYAVGEYGLLHDRPHYHYLLFYYGDLDRFRLLELVKKYWPYGFSQVLPVQGAQGYVTKYILKFDDGEHEVKPFSMISNGIGVSYLSESMVNYHHQNLINYGTKPGGFRVNLPRYYKDKIFTPYERLLLKKRSDLYRREVETIRLDKYDAMLDLGINPFRERVMNYEQRLYSQMNLYKQKKKL